MSTPVAGSKSPKSTGSKQGPPAGAKSPTPASGKPEGTPAAASPKSPRPGGKSPSKTPIAGSKSPAAAKGAPKSAPASSTATPSSGKQSPGKGGAKSPRPPADGPSSGKGKSATSKASTPSSVDSPPPAAAVSPAPVEKASWEKDPPAGGSTPPSASGTPQPPAASPVKKTIAPFGTTPVPQSTKVPQIKVLVGADEDVIPDWKAKRIAAQVPFNMPLKPFIERSICTKMKWDNLNGVRVMVGSGGRDLAQIKATRDVLQMNLTPHQLKLEPDAMVWAWLQRIPEGSEAPQLQTAAEMYRDRLTKFYTYYDASQLDEIESKLSDFKGYENLLFQKLVQRYGPEPTPEMLMRKRIVPKQQQQPSAKPGHSGGGGGDFSGGLGPSRANDILAMQSRFSLEGEMTNIALLMARSSTVLLHAAYFKKWYDWLRSRKEHKRMIHYMTGTQDLYLRRAYFTKLKVYAQTTKTKRQLQRSTKLAYKQESVVGGLAEENSELKSEVRRLKAQIEVLESNSAKRLEALFTSSEGAVNQIRVLTQDLYAKEKLINNLEQRLLTTGNKMLQAQEDKQKALEDASKNALAVEQENLTLREQLSAMQREYYTLKDKVEKSKPKTPPKTCQHCPHYSQVVREVEVHIANQKKLIERVENAEHAKKKAYEQLEAAQREIERMKKESAMRSVAGRLPDGEDPFAGFGPTDTTSAARNTSFAAPPPPGSNQDGASFGDQQGQQQRVTFATDSVFTSNVTGNVHEPAPHYFHESFPSHNNSGSIVQQQQQHLYQSFAGTHQSSATQQQYQQQQQSTGAGSTIIQSPQKVNLSLRSFFAREEELSYDKMRLSLERQTVPKLVTPLGNSMLQSIPKAPAESVNRYVVNQPATRKNPLATAAVLPGMPGDPMVGSHRVDSISEAMIEQSFQLPLAQRPRADPGHSFFAPGATAPPAVMRQNLFSFQR